MDNTNKMRRLTILESIGNKPIVFFLITAALFFVMVQVVYPMIVVMLSVAADEFLTTMLEDSSTRMVFQTSVSLVMALISLLLAVLLTKCFSKKIPAEFPSEEEEKAHYMKNGKWRRTYARILGAFVFFIVLFIAILIETVMSASGSSGGLVILLGVLLSFAFAMISEGLINRHMMKITRTNFYLLQEVFLGYHDGEIQYSLGDDEKGYKGIVKILERGEAHSVSGAVGVILRRQKIRRIAVIGVILAAATGWYLGDALGKGANKYIEDGTDRMLAEWDDNKRRRESAGSASKSGAGKGGAGKSRAALEKEQREADMAERRREKEKYEYRAKHGHNARTSDHNSKIAEEEYAKAQKGGSR